MEAKEPEVKVYYTKYKDKSGNIRTYKKEYVPRNKPRGKRSSNKTNLKIQIRALIKEADEKKLQQIVEYLKN